MITFLAALQSASPSVSPAPDASGSSGALPPSMHDIAPPIHVPWPWWQLVLLALGAAALLAWVIWWVSREVKTHAPPPPAPRQIALDALTRLRQAVETADPYQFSIEVSGVLRTYIEHQYQLRALEQTSPEFLASLTGTARFTRDDRVLLEDFLETADLIKFARQDAGPAESGRLLQSAFSFVEGVRE